MNAPAKIPPSSYWFPSVDLSAEDWRDLEEVLGESLPKQRRQGCVEFLQLYAREVAEDASAARPNKAVRKRLRRIRRNLLSLSDELDLAGADGQRLAFLFRTHRVDSPDRESMRLPDFDIELHQKAAACELILQSLERMLDKGGPTITPLRRLAADLYALWPEDDKPPLAAFCRFVDTAARKIPNDPADLRGVFRDSSRAKTIERGIRDAKRTPPG